nr:uncharacterized protein LOC105484935 [Macaca nemestrina]
MPDRQMKKGHFSGEQRLEPGPTGAHLRVSPPPSAPTVHPAGPGGGCSDAAPTGPRAARPGLPAPGTHRVPASHRLRGSAGPLARKTRRKGCLPSPRASHPPSCGSLQFPLAQVWPRSPARESLRQGRPSRHYSPTTDTEEERRQRQWLWRRREAGREQSGPGKPRENCPETVPQKCQPSVRAMLSVAERWERDKTRSGTARKPCLAWRSLNS